MPDPRNIAPYGRMTRDQHFDLLNRNSEQVQDGDGFYHTNPFWMKPVANQWWEIGEEEYWHFLEVLPPILFDGSNFAICEFWSDDLTHAYFKIGNRYFCGMISAPDPATGRGNLKALRDHIANHMDDYKKPTYAK